MVVLISQPMYFPWVGFLEQLSLADIYVVYDDVQFSRGSFTNRVQIKTATGSKWLTLPITDFKLGKRVNEVMLDSSKNWRGNQQQQLEQAYKSAPFSKTMLSIVKSVFENDCSNLSTIAQFSTQALANFFGISSKQRILWSSQLNIYGKGSERVLNIVKSLGGTTYITGHGARNYLDHSAFEKSGVTVQYMKYRCTPYAQLHGEFNPFVSALDLIANCGRDGKKLIQPSTVYWKDFVNGSE
jgi:hypothetical protein